MKDSAGIAVRNKCAVPALKSETWGTRPLGSKLPRTLDAVSRRCGFVVAGYVLTPEHVHLPVNEPRESSLAVVLQVLNWTDKKRVEKLRYMHRNPVKRGLVSRPESWRWSSFRHYVTGEEGTVEIESRWTAQMREKLVGELGGSGDLYTSSLG